MTIQRMPLSKYIRPWFICVASIACCCALNAEKTTLSSERLLKISIKEESIYKKIAEDPDFYSESDLQRRIEELLQSYRTYLTDHPNDVNALILYAKLLRRTEQTNQSFTAFLKADELDPNIAVVKQQIGTHLAEQGKGKEALTFYLLAVEIEPETALYHVSLGQLLYQFRGEYLADKVFTQDALDRETIKAFRKAATLEPQNFDFQMRLGEAYYDLHSPDWKTAIIHWEQLRKTVTSELQREIIDLHRARVLGKLGRIEEARELTRTIQHPNLQFSRQQVLDELVQY